MAATDQGVRPPADAKEKPKLELVPSRQFPDWLAGEGASLAFTTYQAGKVFLIGTKEDRRLSVFERTLNRCMGLAAAGDALYVSTLWQLWRFENAAAPGQVQDGYDRVYVPQVGYVTGDLDIHDLGVDGDGRLVFVNTLFSCLATTSETHSFEPLWRPGFISRLAAEDRCHLNGLAMRDGRPAFVTAVSESDAADGWRDKRRDGGVVIEVDSGEVVLRGLSMPHSPRWHQGRLWLHNSGTGEFGYADLEAGRFEPVAFCPGYLRGLSLHGGYAVMGLSKPRDNRTFTGLALDDALADKQTEARCGLHVVDLKSGDTVHWLRIEGVVEELYDVVVLPGARRPMAIGMVSDEIRRIISIAKDGAT
ncbi:MAG: TIGR03032 family protein [Kiloniellales bacterium]